MKHAFYTLFAVIICLSACSKKEDQFIIKGTTTQSRLNGQRVFLVPFSFSNPNYEDSIGVDSVVIENNQFEFRGKGEYLARVTMDKKVRYGTQDILIVTEAGNEITVHIDSTSHCGGTPQNEVMEKWKNMKIQYNAITGPKNVELVHMLQSGDTTNVPALRDSLRAFNAEFSKAMLDIVRPLGKGTAYDLLMKMYGE